MRWPWRKRRTIVEEIAPDEILLDSSNIPKLNTDQLEGRVEQPLRRKSFLFVGAFCSTLSAVYLLQAWNLQILSGQNYAARAQDNQLSRTILFADRGIVYDRNGVILASDQRSSDSEYPRRTYADIQGIANVVGYAKHPAKDQNGNYFQEASVGVNGVEASQDGVLQGINGSRLTEENVSRKVISESTLVPQQNGKALTLSIDAAVSQGLYNAIKDRAEGSKFQGGAGVVMDVQTGELLSMVSYPEFPLQLMADGTNTQEIISLLSDKRMPFLDRAVAGLYTPGSIVKPFIAMGALTEGVIDENKQILSTGSISVPNPYDPAHPSIFHDWRPQGWVDMRRAIAVSSDVYFYEIGGGFQGQPGLGIDRIDKYLRMFGFGAPTGIEGFVESTGVIPTPQWKSTAFPGDPWRIGDTYHTAIGQYGVTVTPLQAARAAAAIANNGKLLMPTLIASSTATYTALSIPQHNILVAQEGMRMDVADNETAAAVNVPYVAVAAKTGTAQLGSKNQFMNSWIIGFFPYEHPRFAFAIVLEKAPAGTLVGAPAAAYNFLSYLHQNAPQYLQ